MIGLGRVGVQVSSICSAYGMHVIGYDPLMSTSALSEFNIITALSIEEVFKRCVRVDVVVCMYVNVDVFKYTHIYLYIYI